MGSDADANTVYFALRNWREDVEMYTSLHLTYETDRLSALSGLAARYRTKAALGRYYAGIWEADLPNGLFWQRRYEQTRSEKYVAPSWSWASMIGTKLSTNRIGNLDSQWICDNAIVDIVCDLDGQDPFGAVSRGSLKARVSLVDMSLRKLKAMFATFKITDMLRLDTSLPSEDEMLTIAGFKGTMKKTGALEYRALVLKSVGEREVYNRVGMLKWDNSEKGVLLYLFKDIEPSVITIV